LAAFHFCISEIEATPVGDDPLARWPPICGEVDLSFCSLWGEALFRWPPMTGRGTGFEGPGSGGVDRWPPIFGGDVEVSFCSEGLLAFFFDLSAFRKLLAIGLLAR
jgi:hypothetical protein